MAPAVEVGVGTGRIEAGQNMGSGRDEPVAAAETGAAVAGHIGSPEPDLLHKEVAAHIATRDCSL